MTISISILSIHRGDNNRLIFLSKNVWWYDKKIAMNRKIFAAHLLQLFNWMKWRRIWFLSLEQWKKSDLHNKMTSRDHFITLSIMTSGINHSILLKMDTWIVYSKITDLQKCFLLLNYSFLFGIDTDNIFELGNHLMTIAKDNADFHSSIARFLWEAQHK